jgi:hypothetical protein
MGVSYRSWFDSGRCFDRVLSASIGKLPWIEWQVETKGVVAAGANCYRLHPHHRRHLAPDVCGMAAFFQRAKSYHMNL